MRGIVRFKFEMSQEKRLEYMWIFFRAGMETGDIITHINGIPVKEAADLYSLSDAETDTEIAVIHHGKKKKLKVASEMKANM